ncbi:hypothetical protein [Rhizobium sp. RAF56]|uniref:hypothetical protein n=1 Tax=Rhizobium sp. RAF56 TaxID=3233062 RepID=UPI003F9C9AFA
MIKHVNLTDPADLKVVNGWIFESRIRMVKAMLLGSAAVILATGLGIAAVLWATRPGPDPEALGEAFKAALGSLPPLPVTGSVALADGAQVALQDGGEVSLADGGEVSLKASSIPTMPQIPPVTAQQKSDAIKRQVTVFTSAPFGDGEVVTGWKFAAGDAKKPGQQYCYFSRDIPGKPSERVDIAVDGIRSPVAANLMPNADSAIEKCVWWQG